jgi:O-antigen/teichoic acid export membrane protein
VIRLANPLILAFGSVIVPTVVRARERAGMLGAKRLFTTSLITGLIGLTILFAIPTIWPAPVIRIFYPNNAENYLPHMRVLQIITFWTLLMFAKETMASFLNAIERPRLSFLGQVSYAAGMVLLAMPLTARYGLVGMAIGATVAALVHLIVNIWLMRSLEQRPIAVPAV